MKVLGNICWLLFGGLEAAIGYVVGSLALMVTIIGIPFALQTLKIAVLMLWPFGSKVVKVDHSFGCLNTVMNIIWFFCGGIWIWFIHVLFGILLYISILGIPFGQQHFKLAGLALHPFGREITSG